MVSDLHLKTAYWINLWMC